MTNPQADYDSPWKEALEIYFTDFMAFFFPQAYADINWSQGYEFLDTELQQVVRDAELGRRRVDKLVKVWRQNGEETWVLIHIEVQSKVDANFAERMYVYNYRLFDRYRRQVASLAVLADEQASWRPQSYDYEIWGARVSLQFPTVKLLDYEAQWQSLEQSANPFAVIIMAHLKAQATRRNPEGRLQWKLSLVRGLYGRGYSRENILELFRLIEWMMVLPEEFQFGFEETLSRYEEERRMPFITPIERRGIRKGIVQNSRENVIEVLETRFETVPSPIVESVNGIDDPALLKQLLKQAITVSSVEEFQQAIALLSSQGESGTV
ncbi:transposase [Coleofasciculus sp. FACHB-1120]|uniref:transposase n=1 Tax=Coleofasciculus sp. FACHB-1120 TaxID=2692783 RepID=UPI0016883AE5|nr:transposase [Coleofasciculus sp. FACHB-1120]MBD2741227.1 transposase [Coleofasciculus sp. FACHB-1120]